MVKRPQRYLSLAQIDHLPDKDFTDYLIALLQMSNEDPIAETLARMIWATMIPEQRTIFLRHLGLKATPQGIG